MIHCNAGHRGAGGNMRRECALAAFVLAFSAAANNFGADRLPEIPAESAISGRISVLVFNYSPASSNTVADAIAEADRIFKERRLPIDWIDCSRPSADRVCNSAYAFTAPIVRIVRAALPEATEAALGITGRCDTGAIAAVFHDRAVLLAARHPDIFTYRVLGVAMAHEAVHLLLPLSAHDGHGLMRPRFYVEDFHVARGGRFLIPSTLAACIRREVARMSHSTRTYDALNTLPKERSNHD